MTSTSSGKSTSHPAQYCMHAWLDVLFMLFGRMDRVPALYNVSNGDHVTRVL